MPVRHPTTVNLKLLTKRNGTKVWFTSFYLYWRENGAERYTQRRRQFAFYPDLNRSEAEEAAIQIRDRMQAKLNHICALKDYREGQRAIQRSDGLTDITGKLRGPYAEVLVCADLFKKGYEVFKSLSPFSSCDIVALKTGVLTRIEAKWGLVSEDGRPLVKWEHNAGKFDLMAVVAPDGSVRYFDPELKEVTAPQASQEIA